MDRACGQNGIRQEYFKNFNWETYRKETFRKAWMWMREQY